MQKYPEKLYLFLHISICFFLQINNIPHSPSQTSFKATSYHPPPPPKKNQNKKIPPPQTYKKTNKQK